MQELLWVVVGLLLVIAAVLSTVLARLPLTSAILYLLAGVGLGPYGLALVRLDMMRNSALIEVLSEIVVIISLFGAGLQLRTPITDRRWLLPVSLAVIAMTATVGLSAVVGVYLFSLPIGAAILLGAVLAPTDPVLASSVQIESPDDKDDLRFGLTGEAGLNDGTAFPFVMLGVGLLGLSELGSYGMRWVLVDLLWAVFAGLLIGWFLGGVVGKLVLYVRREHKEGVGFDDLLALGLIALSYGVALLCHAYGFLAVFAAGLSLRHIEMEHTGHKPTSEIDVKGDEEVATDQEKAPAYLVHTFLSFSHQLEHIGEAAMVTLIGAMITKDLFSLPLLISTALLLLVIRPLSVALGLFLSRTSSLQKILFGWFGVRGIGSIYYLTHGLNFGVSEEVARTLTSITLVVIIASILFHGMSVTAVMNYYERHKKKESKA